MRLCVKSKRPKLNGLIWKKENSNKQLNFYKKEPKHFFKPFIQIMLFGIFEVLVALLPLFVEKRLVNKSFQFIGIEKWYDKKIKLMSWIRLQTLP